MIDTGKTNYERGPTMIDPHHYGSSKSAIYLSDLLANDVYTRRKIDRLMQSYNERLADILYSNIPGSTKIWCMTAAMHIATESFNKFDTPVNTVAQNVVKGFFKEALRTVAVRGETTKHGQHYSTFFKNIPSYENKVKHDSIKT